MWTKLAVYAGTILSVVLLTCQIPPPPPGPDEATISLLLTSSNGTMGADSDTVTDTVGNVGTIAVISYLPMHIDSVKIDVSTGDQTVKDYFFKPSKNRSDTAEYPILLTNPGIYQVVVTGFVTTQPDLVAKGTIKIIRRPSADDTNEPPVLTVSGQQFAVADEPMQLTLSATDPDEGQTVTISALKIPEAAAFSSDTFRWTPVLADTGSDTLIFIATDNGTPDALSDTATVIVVITATAVNHPPKWINKKIQKSALPGTLFTYAAGANCIDPDDDSLTFLLAEGSPDGDTLIGSLYTITPSDADTGKHTVTIIGSDPDGLADTLTIELNISNNKADVIAPVIERISPADDSVSISSSSIQLTVSCKDESGIDSVECLLGTTPFGVVKSGDFNYVATVTGLEESVWNTVVFIARDASEAKNPCTLLVHLKYDKAVSDNVPPTIAFISPSKDTIIDADSFEVKVTCKDENGVSQVKGYCDTAEFNLTRSASQENEWTGMAGGIVAGRYSAIKIIATDSSEAKNRDSISINIKYDNDKTGPAIEFLNPVNDTAAITSTSYTIVMKCTDGSGIRSVNGTAEDMAFTGRTDIDSLWKIKLNVEANTTTMVIVSATDRSLKANTTFDTIYITCEILNGYTITFDRNDDDASGEMAEQTINSGDSAALYENEFTKEGWTFDGWALSETGAVVYGDGALFKMGSADITLFAKWSAKKFKVSFNKNDAGATGSMDTLSLSAGAVAALPENTFNKNGSKFAGWATSPAGAVVYADKANYTMGTADEILYAKWDPNLYAITFLKNDADATGSMPEQTIASGKVAPLTVNTFDKPGWTFTGWATSATGAIEYADASNYTMGAANDTLFAKWSQNVFKITFDKNDPGATGSMNAQNISSGDAAPLKSNAFSKPGYTFAGWATSSAGAVVYTDGASFIMGAADVALYAKWTISTYKLSVVTNSKEGSITAPATSPVTVDHNTATTITASASSGYTFSGWTVTSGTATIADAKSASTTVTLASGDAVVTAAFTLNTYKLTVAAGTGGTIKAPTTSPVTVNHNASTAVTAAASAGYTFAGWKVTTGTATITSASAASTTIKLTSGNATVTASFTLNTYSLTVSAGTGGTIKTPASSPVKVDYNAATSIIASASTGYTFSGWTVISGSATITDATSASTTVKLTTGDAAIAANFTLKSYSLSVVASPAAGGKITLPSTSPVTVTHNAETKISASPATGYDFAGWKVTTGSAAIADANAASTTVKLTSGDAAITANFTLKTYSLSVVAGSGGTRTAPASSPVTVNHNASTTITVTPSSGYSFAGWEVTSGTATITSASSASTTVKLTSGSATVTANFTIIPVAVATWTLNGTINSGTAFPVTSTVTNVTASTLSKASALTAASFANAFVADDWPSGSLTTTKYFQFSVTAASGHQLVYNSVRFSIYNNMAGSTSWAIRSSVDSYAANLATGSSSSIATGGSPVNADVSALGTRSGTVTFRVYTYNNSGSSYPLQRGFRGSSASGTDLKVWAGVK